MSGSERRNCEDGEERRGEEEETKKNGKCLEERERNLSEKGNSRSINFLCYKYITSKKACIIVKVLRVNIHGTTFEENL